MAHLRALLAETHHTLAEVTETFDLEPDVMDVRGAIAGTLAVALGQGGGRAVQLGGGKDNRFLVKLR